MFLYDNSPNNSPEPVSKFRETNGVHDNLYLDSGILSQNENTGDLSMKMDQNFADTYLGAKDIANGRANTSQAQALSSNLDNYIESYKQEKGVELTQQQAAVNVADHMRSGFKGTPQKVMDAIDLDNGAGYRFASENGVFDTDVEQAVRADNFGDTYQYLRAVEEGLEGQLSADHNQMNENFNKAYSEASQLHPELTREAYAGGLAQGTGYLSESLSGMQKQEMQGIMKDQDYNINAVQYSAGSTLYTAQDVENLRKGDGFDPDRLGDGVSNNTQQQSAQVAPAAQQPAQNTANNTKFFDLTNSNPQPSEPQSDKPHMVNDAGTLRHENKVEERIRKTEERMDEEGASPEMKGFRAVGDNETASLSSSPQSDDMSRALAQAKESGVSANLQEKLIAVLKRRKVTWGSRASYS